MNLNKVGAVIKSQCRLCNRQTNHTVKSIETSSESSEEYDFYSTERYAIIQCLGCEVYSFVKEYQDNQAFEYDEHGDELYKSTVDNYPIVLKDHKALSGTWYLPESIKLMYTETVASLAADCKVLAGVGCRAIIEAVCLDKAIAGKDLEAKINNLLKKALITKNECDRLHSIRFIGNDSVHEMKVPKDEQLRLVLHIVEHLLSNLYLIDVEANNKLEGIINDYKAFRRLLISKLSSYTSGEEHYLSRIFDKDYRRVKDNYANFEAELLTEIGSGKFKALSLGVVKAKSADPKAAVVQYFIIT